LHGARLRILFLKTPATTKTSTLSLHDALPIFDTGDKSKRIRTAPTPTFRSWASTPTRRPNSTLVCVKAYRTRPSNVSDGCWIFRDRKSTRLNSSHVKISYAVFCLKKKNKKKQQ